MNREMHLEKTKRLETLLKSQVIYDYMLDLMGIKVKNRLPKEEYIRKAYDNSRPEVLSANPQQQLSVKKHIQAVEKEELIKLLDSSKLLRYIALMQAGVDYGVNAQLNSLEQNLKKVIPPKPYAIAQNKIRIPADKIKSLSLA